MPKLSADQIATMQHQRAFIQYGGSSPANRAEFAGLDGQYVAIEGVTIPENGSIDPVYRYSPSRPKEYVLVATSTGVPELPAATFMFSENHGSIPRQLLKTGCLSAYIASGRCKDLGSFLTGSDNFTLILENGRVNGSKDGGGRVSFDADDAIVDSVPMQFSAIYPVGALSFGPNASTLIKHEIKGVVYGMGSSCNNCDPEEAVSRIYAITETGSASPGLPASLVYTVDKGLNWTEVAINNIGLSESVLSIAIAGNYLIVLGADAYYWSIIDSDTGIPGTFSKVTSGIVAAGSPTDIYVKSTQSVWFCGDGGYIYRSTNIPDGVEVINAGSATSSDLNRINGSGDEIWCVGDTGTIVVSFNGGNTFALTESSPTGSNLIALEVLDDIVFIGSSSTGSLYYSKKNGKVWTQISFSGSGAGGVRDIVFVTPSVGYMAHNTAGNVARLFVTWNGGADWGYIDGTTNTASARLVNFTAANHINRIAVPREIASSDPGRAANNVVLGGLAGGAIDGFLLLGSAAVF